MSRNCSVCLHPNREDIDKLLLNKEPLISIASQYPPLSQSALDRHKSRHLVNSELAIVHQETEELREISINDELKKIFHRISLLFDACDRWLRDPDNPEQYDIDLRSNEIMVHYYFELDNGKRIKKKALLSTLLNEIMMKTDRPFGDFEIIETKNADPRELTLHTAMQLQKQLEFLAKLIGRLDERPQIVTNIALVQNPEWYKLRTLLLNALEDYPEAAHHVAIVFDNANHSQ